MHDSFSPAEQEALSPYVSNIDRDVFVVHHLPEEVVAVLFAYYSRSRDSLRRNLLKLLSSGDTVVPATGPKGTEADLANAEARARAFHEKWVIGYGHASVAEHGVVHLAVENVSILASKVIEDARLASFTEKSTRYVTFDRSRYHRPDPIVNSRFATEFSDTIETLFDAYTAWNAPLTQHLRTRFPIEPGVSRRAHEAAVRARACDVLRTLLPAATLTNLGMTINGRALAHLVTKLLSHPLLEVRRLGADLRREGRTVLPTLLRHAEPNPYLARTDAALEGMATRTLAEIPVIQTPSVSLIRYDPDAELELAAAILYPHARMPLEQLRTVVRDMPRDQIARIVDEALKRRGAHDAPGRAFEHISYTFDLLVDFGAYRDIQRHRIATQAAQRLSVDHGYEIPEELDACGLGDSFEDLMDRAAETYHRLVGSFPEEASYVVPLAFRRRVVFTMNLRELFHFVELRSSPQGHRSYRRLAQEMFRLVAQVHPLVARYIRVSFADGGLERLMSERRQDERA